MNNALDSVYLNHSMTYEQRCRQTEVCFMSKSGILSGLFIFFSLLPLITVDCYVHKANAKKISEIIEKC